MPQSPLVYFFSFACHGVGYTILFEPHPRYTYMKERDRMESIRIFSSKDYIGARCEGDVSIGLRQIAIGKEVFM
jgi:hypothetical protein